MTFVTNIIAKDQWSNGNTVPFIFELCSVMIIWLPYNFDLTMLHIDQTHCLEVSIVCSREINLNNDKIYS